MYVAVRDLCDEVKRLISVCPHIAAVPPVAAVAPRPAGRRVPRWPSPATRAVPCHAAVPGLAEGIARFRLRLGLRDPVGLAGQSNDPPARPDSSVDRATAS